MALPCPGGAIPKPGLTAATALLDLGLVGTDVLDHITAHWPGLLSQQIWGRVDVATLCAQQAEDPGPPSAEDLAYTAILAAQAAGGALGGAYGSWALKQIYYQVFLNSCQCAQAGQTPPPRIPIPPDTTNPPFPRDHSDQDQLTRIEQNQGASTDALRQLYGVEQWSLTNIVDLRMRLSQNFIRNGNWNTFQISGEGSHPLLAFFQEGGGSQQDMLGVQVRIDQLPTKFKVQGSLTPRYYGIGSLYFDVTPPDRSPYIIGKRHSLHYLQEFVEGPTLAAAHTLRWRLMPGAVATVWQIERDTREAIYKQLGPDYGAFVAPGGGALPPGWVDPPLYPGTRSLPDPPSGGGLPPAPFPCCS